MNSTRYFQPWIMKMMCCFCRVHVFKIMNKTKREYMVHVIEKDSRRSGSTNTY